MILPPDLFGGQCGAPGIREDKEMPDLDIAGSGCGRGAETGSPESFRDFVSGTREAVAGITHGYARPEVPSAAVPVVVEVRP
ncbi:hypothetical protein ACPESR_10805 [Nocardia testacea]|uniref:hypothetical protein n=1 Tax=Nocardia testacea TaxID=248551 RepID=UPI003C2B0F15